MNGRASLDDPGENSCRSSGPRTRAAGELASSACERAESELVSSDVTVGESAAAGAVETERRGVAGSENCVAGNPSTAQQGEAAE